MKRPHFVGDPAFFRQSVFDNEAETDLRFEQIREHVLCLDEWRLEDAREIEDLRTEIRSLKRSISTENVATVGSNDQPSNEIRAKGSI